jgi:hypothetical protein
MSRTALTSSAEFVQLALFAAAAIDPTVVRKPRFNKEVPEGPARLLRALAGRGLRRDCYLAGARLVLELDAQALEARKVAA